MAKDIEWHRQDRAANYALIDGVLVVVSSKMLVPEIHEWRATIGDRVRVGTACSQAMAEYQIRDAVKDLLEAHGDDSTAARVVSLTAQLEAADAKIMVLSERLHQAAGDLELAKADAEAMA